ncbi:PLP-dependent cysteine synthase family protein [Sphingobacterium hungaricum]|uniref:PLP-dependent cysteine synthase family protein n=1 Tax=Sphingobacterium hungaricum TaxID=2082723 RepID=UPI0018CB245A|nr:cysteine synthase family protein [Sphingobacterium hungaricum]
MIHELIGNTPLRKCGYLSTENKTNIYIKEEFHNPGMSSKDRPALYMIQDAIAKNKIKKGGEFVEASSGNTGLGIAMIANELGFKSTIFVSQTCSDEKIAMLESAGARVEICENSNGLHDFYSTQFKAQSYASNHPNAYFTNQYYNSGNIKAHYLTTGPEIWEQTKGKITHFIVGVGTGGTISGVGRYLKEQNKDIKIWGVEPSGSILSHFLEYGEVPDDNTKMEPIEGIGRTFVPGSFDGKYVDKIFQIGYQESADRAVSYRKDSGLLTGFSSAAVIAALDKYVEDMDFQPNDLVVLLFPDHGSRYISKLYAGETNASFGSSIFTNQKIASQ